MYRVVYCYSTSPMKETLFRGNPAECRRYADWYRRKHSCKVELVDPWGKTFE